MKRSKLSRIKPAAIAVGLFLGRGAQADTILTFDAAPPGQAPTGPVAQTFGDNVVASGPGIQVNGAGTPDIGLTWQATGGRWDFYIDSVWAAGQLDSSAVGDVHELVFTPSPTKAVVIKSLNFHPYYNNALDYTYDWQVLSGATVLTNGSIAVPADATKNHPLNIKYQGTNGQVLTLQLSRTGGAGSSGGIAVDDITFAQFPAPAGPGVTFVTPGQGAVSVSPQLLFNANIRDASTTVNTNTIQLSLNGTSVAANISKTTNLTTISFQAPGLLPPGSNYYTLLFRDSASTLFSNRLDFMVAAYTNLVLPTPFVFENFNSTPEGALPAGWTQLNYTDQSFSDTNQNLTNLDSATFATWTVVEAWRFTNSFTVYSDTNSPVSWQQDYQRVLSVNPSNVVNGVFLTNLATGRFLFGNSGYRNGRSQVLYAYTPDFNLTGRSNVHLSYHSLWEQNQDSIGAVEYSIDRGTNWQPVVYMLDGPDILMDANTNVDAVATFSTLGTGIAFYTDPADGQDKGGFYGAFIGVEESRWNTLAPYISARVDDNPVESKRVEIFRLPLADNQANVRFRFAHAGTDSWYFGIDDFGLYEIGGATGLRPSLSIRKAGGQVTVSWPAGSGGTLFSSSNLITGPWTPVSGVTGNTVTVPANQRYQFFRLQN